MTARTHFFDPQRSKNDEVRSVFCGFPLSSGILGEINIWGAEMPTYLFSLDLVAGAHFLVDFMVCDPPPKLALVDCIALSQKPTNERRYAL